MELYRVRCPDCGLKIEKVDQLPSQAPFSKRFEEAVGEACESAAARRVAKQFGLAESTVRAIDLGYLERWNAQRTRAGLKKLPPVKVAGGHSAFRDGGSGRERGRAGELESNRAHNNTELI